MPGAYSILVVDDEEPIRRLLQKELAAPHRRIQTAATAAKALEMCRRESFEVVLLDIRMGNENGLELLPLFLRRLPDAKVIMITGYADVDGAVTAMRNGAYDFVAKPFTLEKLELIIDRAFEHTCLTRENRSYRLSSNAEESLVGTSQAVRHTLYLIEKVAPSEVPVLITGESGTGKDVVAAAVHRHSKRASFPYVVKNCAGLQPDLARSELFGYAKGAFTNALESREGLMTFAHRGTLFLDEVGELGLEVQAQLLRVLESRRYRRLGEKEERRADVRFLFATNRNLAQEVERGRFHEALFHRINVFQIHLTPLKERPEDITPLARHFLAKLGGEDHSIAPEAMNRLLRYRWPGNARELRNVIERGIILAEDSVITEQALPRELVEAVPPRKTLGEEGVASSQAPLVAVDSNPDGADVSGHTDRLHGLPEYFEDFLSEDRNASPEHLRLEDMERAHIAHVLGMHGGNKLQAAKALGIARKTLYRKIQDLGIG